MPRRRRRPPQSRSLEPANRRTESSAPPPEARKRGVSSFVPRIQIRGWSSIVLRTREGSSARPQDDFQAAPAFSPAVAGALYREDRLLDYSGLLCPEAHEVRV